MSTNLCICGKIAVFSLLSSLTSLLIVFIIKNIFTFGDNIINDWFYVIFVTHALVNHVFLGLRYYKRSKLYFHVSLRAGLLGEGLALGVLMSTLGTTDWSSTFGLYLMILSLFHFSEYIMTAIINPRFLSLDSFLLNHSKEYGLAALAAVLEFTIESYFWPQMKSIPYLTAFGVVFSLFGELLRKSAMITSGSNFNHIIQNRREDGHILVTHGVYALCRHPSYVGWFCWSIGTQLILMNPICVVVYAIVVWKFFNERIFEEEIYLLNFFGEEYVKYKRLVPTGLPFIHGYRSEL